MTRYVIIGAGAVGVTMAAELRAADRDVVLVARGAQLAKLRAGSMRYIRPAGTRQLDLAAVGGPGELTLTDDDVLVLATKTQDADATLQEWAWQPVGQRAAGQPGDRQRSAAEALPVVTVQNGLDTERSALRRFAAVFGGVIWIPASYLAPGEVACRSSPAPGVIWLGPYPDGPVDGDQRLCAVAADLRAAGFEVQLVHDLSRWKAAKLLAAVTFALDALYEPSDLRATATRLLTEEARHILTASGIAIADMRAESTADLDRFSIQQLPGQPGGTSSWQSLTRSGSLETDYLTGEIVLQARLLGLRATASEAVLQRIRRAVRDATPPRSLSDADLLATLPVLASPPQHGEGVLIDADALRDLLGRPDAPALLDVRWALGDPAGRKHYLDGHIPGAVYADLDSELAAPPAPATGRHPLPTAEALQRSARSWGVRDGQTVIVYDDNGGLAAARAWWLLRWAGITDVRILDGALTAWQRAGFDLQAGEHNPSPGDVRLDGGHLPVVTADEAASIARAGVLLDARAGERYRGETEPIDRRAGHIPGAVSAPASGNLTAGGTFCEPAALRLRYAALGVTPGRQVAVYCGSGVTAAHDVAALQIAGIAAALFPGSWSQWSADPDRGTATGPAPG
jgi:thiosulfate/3-mercaptopyruvate sulfurtransferase